MAKPAARHPTAIRRVTTGPATAIRNSAPGESVSRLMRATPPNSHSVMSVMPMPSRRATMACPISCSRIDPKNASALTTASA